MTRNEEVKMDATTPQEAFNNWLRDCLRAAFSAMRRDEAHLAYLAQSVDHADLKRRMRVHELFC